MMSKISSVIRMYEDEIYLEVYYSIINTANERHHIKISYPALVLFELTLTR
jgi:hypothetical protein